MEKESYMSMKELFPPMSARELSGAAISRNAAAQGMVLLKNDNKVLPLTEGNPIALFGNGAARTVRGGTGSGDPFNGGLSGGGDMDVNLSPRYHVNILDALEKSYPVVNTSQLLAYAKLYDKARNAQKDHVMSVFAFPEEALAETDICGYAEKTDTAVCVISRNSGEGNDRSKTKEVQIDGIAHEIGDYCLSQTEKDNLQLLRKSFRKLILILNVAGPISVSDLRTANADAVLLMGQAGQEGGAALLDVLSGQVTPSGKLTATWGECYEDYPAYETYLKEPLRAPYPEGIYVGYRYFDTFGKQPGYPFGFGLSYTTFTVGEQKGQLKGESIRLSAKVKNIGDFSGREVLQAYVSAPTTELDMPEKELKGFQKTGLLVPGQEEVVEIVIPIRSLASYSEKHGGYILSAGDYRISLGTSSRDVTPVCCLRVPETICTKRVYPELPLQEKLEEYVGCTSRKNDPVWENVPTLELESPLQTEDGHSPYHDGAVTTYTTDPDYQAVMPYEQVQLVSKGDWKLSDVAAGKITMEEFVAQLSNEQLADLCCGTGWGVSDANNPVVGASSESVPGAAGETTHRLEDSFGVPSVVLADGPGGVRVTQVFEATDLETGKKRTLYHYCTAWPVGTLLAQSFDPEVLESVGRGMAADMEELQIALILGPGINIQRNPMCGRNFEYYSEDPLLTGELAAAQIRGIQSVPGCGGCIKHFAANNQEYNRNASNSVVGQRALREIYLEPFKIAVEKSQPWSIMTSYNLINGVPSADSYDLCTDLARGEWGFEGLIMTDWNGGSSTPWISMHAGNDLIMPGGKARMLNILQEVETVPPYFDEKGQVLMEQEVPFWPVRTARWNSFVPSAAGNTVLTVALGDHHLAEERDGKVLVDGEPIYLEAADAGIFFKDPKNFVPYTRLVDTEVASVAEDGKAIVYHGTYNEARRICRGDVQKCAANILRIIIKARNMESSDD